MTPADRWHEINREARQINGSTFEPGEDEEEEQQQQQQQSSSCFTVCPSHCVPVYGRGGRGGGDGGNGRGLWRTFRLRLGREGLFGAADPRYYFLYVSERQHRTEQRPHFTLQDKETETVSSESGSTF